MSRRVQHSLNEVLVDIRQASETRNWDGHVGDAVRKEVSVYWIRSARQESFDEVMINLDRGSLLRKPLRVPVWETAAIRNDSQQVLQVAVTRPHETLDGSVGRAERDTT